MNGERGREYKIKRKQKLEENEGPRRELKLTNNNIQSKNFKFDRLHNCQANRNRFSQNDFKIHSKIKNSIKKLENFW